MNPVPYSPVLSPNYPHSIGYFPTGLDLGVLGCAGLLGSGGLFCALVDCVGLCQVGQGSTALQPINVHVKLLPVNTKLLSVDMVDNSKYKQGQCQQEPGKIYYSPLEYSTTQNTLFKPIQDESSAIQYSIAIKLPSWPRLFSHWAGLECARLCRTAVLWWALLGSCGPCWTLLCTVREVLHFSLEMFI